jgi:hypothetical protein
LRDLYELLRNSTCGLQRYELESERFGFEAQFVLLTLREAELIGCEPGVVEFVSGGYQVKDDARQFVGGGGNGFWCAEFRAHTPIEIA